VIVFLLVGPELSLLGFFNAKCLGYFKLAACVAPFCLAKEGILIPCISSSHLMKMIKGFFGVQINSS